MKEPHIAIIGCGNLGHAIANGLLEKVPAHQITATRRNTSALQDLQEQGVQVTSDNARAVRNAQVIILALKPYNIGKVLEEIHKDIPKGALVISLATGVTLQDLETLLNEEVKVFRAMPNTAADVNESMTCLCTHTTEEASKQYVQEIFKSIGNAIYIDENLMNAATVIDACGIAYVLRFIRAMIQGGIQIGFDAKTATEIVTQTVKGAAELVIENHTHPEEEIDKVTTPKGCTIVGLNEMEHNGFSSALIKGIVASYEEIS